MARRRDTIPLSVDAHRVLNAAFRCHRAHDERNAQSDALLEIKKSLAGAVGTTVLAEMIRSPIDKTRTTLEWDRSKVEPVHQYAASRSAKEFLDKARHLDSWTSRIIGKNKLEEKMQASGFKLALLGCFDALPEHHLRDSLAGNRVVLINATGQYLKPLISSLVKTGAAVDVVVLHPERCFCEHDGSPDRAGRLSVLEFVWSLPVSLRPPKNGCSGTLRILAANELSVPHAALFPGWLTAESNCPPLDIGPHLRGHPSTDGRRSLRFEGTHDVRVLLHGHREFTSLHQQITTIVEQASVVLEWDWDLGFRVNPAFGLDDPGRFFK